MTILTRTVEKIPERKEFILVEIDNNAPGHSREENITSQCNPALPAELVEDAQKIKGDAIGNTLYSQCWVLKVLMKLAELSNEGLFDEVLEKDLCLLWDMTVEEDVVWFLVNNDIIDIIVFTLQKEQEPRLMEILVGMLGNLCVVAEVSLRIMNCSSVCELMVKLLFCVDSLTLVQLMRLYTTCLQRLQSNKEIHRIGILSESINSNSVQECSANHSNYQLSEKEDKNNQDSIQENSGCTFIKMLLDTDSWYKQITFLLQSSTSGPLLLSMLQMLDDLYPILADCGTVSPSIYTAELIAAVLEALRELKACVSASVGTDTSRKALFQSVSVLSNFVDSAQGISALCEIGDPLTSYICTHVDEEYLCESLSLDSVQFVMGCLNIFGCTFASLASKTDVTSWSVSLLGHLTERIAARQFPACGEGGFEAEDKEEEERHFDSSELMLEVENLCVFVVKCLSGDSNRINWLLIKEVLQGRCKQTHLDVLKSVIQKHCFEDGTVYRENN